MLPATGDPVSRHRTSKMKEMFDEYVRARTRQDWKFWIVSFFALYLKASLWICSIPLVTLMSTSSFNIC